MLPSQTHAVDGFAWVEDISNISSSLYGCLFSQVDPHVWQPRLRLGTTSGDTVASTPIPNSLDHPWSHLRPFHFTFLLPAAHESDFCFKVRAVAQHSRVGDPMDTHTHICSTHFN